MPTHQSVYSEVLGFDHHNVSCRSTEQSPSPTLTSRPVSALDHSGQTIRWGQRPKSSPYGGGHKHTPLPSHSSKISRPKTAAVILGRTECNRVHQLENEPTRRHNFENHLPVKRSKPPPWQKNLEPPLVPFVAGPGYILSRSKNKYAVTIRDDFFDSFHEDSASGSKSGKRSHADPERDQLIAQLQQQISDLTLYLEEERMNHKQSKQKAEEYLKDKVDQLNSQHQDHMREMEAEHKDQLHKQKSDLEADHKEYQTTTERQINRMAKEIEFVQGAFESYKTTLHMETTDKWNTKEEELNVKHADEKQQALHEMKTKLIQERNQERSTMAKEHHRAIDLLRKENKKELDGLLRRFSNAAADIERLKKTTTELEETKQELELVSQSYNETCQQLTSTTRHLRDSKLRIMDFEERFQDKVTQVDDKYRHKLQELMTQNTELKRLFVEKCGQLFNEKSHSESKKSEKTKTAKETMESLIKSRQRANISIAIGGPASSKKLSKSRPLSAPGTRVEQLSAHESAGEIEVSPTREDKCIVPDLNLDPNPETEELRAELLSSGRGDYHQGDKKGGDLLKMLTDI